MLYPNNLKNRFLGIKCLFFLFSLSQLFSGEVHFVSSFNIDELPTGFHRLKEKFVLKKVCPSDYFVDISPHDPSIAKIIVFDPFYNRVVIPQLPKEKLILFEWEPKLYPLDFYAPYSKVYTWNDALIDGKKFFRFNYPYLTAPLQNSPPFEKRKLCTMVVGNWTQERLDLLQFFHHVDGFEFYGRCPLGYEGTPKHLGHIPGLHTGVEKILTLSNYRFCICFENTIGLPGYITEKIFSCFAAGCIPIYWGAKNVENYIPKTCFIDYSDFDGPPTLYHYLIHMSKDRYDEYLVAIKEFIKSEKGKIFSGEFFDQLLLDAVLN